MIVTDNASCWWQESRRLSVYFMSLLLLYWQATDLSWPAFENTGWYRLASMFDMRMNIKHWPPSSVFLWFACSQMLSHAAYQGTFFIQKCNVTCRASWEWSKIKQANNVFLLVGCWGRRHPPFLHQCDGKDSSLLWKVAMQ